MKKRSFWGIISVLTLAALMLATVVMAQEATETPMSADQPAATEDAAAQGGALGLEDLTADPAAYTGQTVTLEGVITNLLNVRAFVLGEGAALDDDQVVIINTSGEEFDIRLTDGARFRVTGIVYPSFAGGGVTQLIAEMAQLGQTGSDPAAQATEAVGNVPAYTTDLAQMILPDDLFNHTIIALRNIQDIQFLELPER